MLASPRTVAILGQSCLLKIDDPSQVIEDFAAKMAS
jgi:hypothetical protein